MTQTKDCTYNMYIYICMYMLARNPMCSGENFWAWFGRSHPIHFYPTCTYIIMMCTSDQLCFKQPCPDRRSKRDISRQSPCRFPVLVLLLLPCCGKQSEVFKNAKDACKREVTSPTRTNITRKWSPLEWYVHACMEPNVFGREIWDLAWKVSSNSFLFHYIYI